MAIQTGTFHPKADNLIRNGRDGGLRVGSPEAAEAIARVGRAVCGKNWQPFGSGYEFYGRNFKAISNAMKARMAADEA
jgi:hypothetical protein